MPPAQVLWEFFQSITDVRRWLLPSKIHFSLEFPWVRAASILYNLTCSFSDGKLTQFVGSAIFPPQDAVLFSYVYTRVYTALQFVRLEHRIDDYAIVGFDPSLISQSAPVVRSKDMYTSNIPASSWNTNASESPNQLSDEIQFESMNSNTASSMLGICIGVVWCPAQYADFYAFSF
jgi:hypothetical protein